jgi:hypothetical protein
MFNDQNQEQRTLFHPPEPINSIISTQQSSWNNDRIMEDLSIILSDLIHSPNYEVNLRKNNDNLIRELGMDPEIFREQFDHLDELSLSSLISNVGVGVFSEEPNHFESDEEESDEEESDRVSQAQTASIESYQPHFVPATENVISRMLKITHFDHSYCSLCLDSDEQEKGIVQTPCGHQYHMTCLQKWLSNGNFCPVCRFKL